MFICVSIYQMNSMNWANLIWLFTGTTKGTGGDILILEEAAYVDSYFFYETVAPLLLVGVTSLICISTLTSDIKWVSLQMFMMNFKLKLNTLLVTVFILAYSK